MSVDPSTVACLLLPLDGVSLLVPRTLVAEVVDLDTSLTAGSGLRWGELSWRGLRIPLIRFEQLLGETPSAPGARARVAILKGEAPDTAFFGVVTVQVPRLLRVVEDQIVSLAEPPPGGAARIRLGDEEAVIPDVPFLEQRLSEHPSA